ncbi:hypothetical protein GCM10023231_11880 [Olivibacter ginsenosidimutans]|uniref:Glycosyl transferase family 28 C-terminal domain-containing protein n=1 Tax=Olivibacter ginsenosidimutans TaxID=1176537 RepID=A0ABP9AWJ4_9SPHI
MIFVTTGTQASFDRLIKAIDEIANQLTGELIYAQVLETEYSVKSDNMKLIGFLSQGEFENYYSNARLIVSHAGTGSIFSALTSNKPIIVLPRRASLGEHRNEHQMATAKKFKDIGLLEVAFDENELKTKILECLKELKPLNQKTIGKYASDSFILNLKSKISAH